MTRENKLAIVIGFGLLLFVGILVSDHLSARNAQIANPQTTPARFEPPQALPGEKPRSFGTGPEASPPGRPSDGAFGIDDIDRIIVEEVKVKVNNPDTVNNLANFQDGTVTLSSNTNPTPLTLATGPIPDVYADEKVLPAVSGNDIKGYLKSNTLTYTLNAKLRRPTTKALDGTLNVKFRVE